MRAAVVHSFYTAPKYEAFEQPDAQVGEALLSVRAAALSPLVRGQTSGKHYSSVAALPFVAGVDGVGTLLDGQRVYFAFPRAPYGAMAERAPVQHELYTPVPEDLDDITVAALANPGMSSWAALTARAKLVAGEIVLVNGATGAAGRLAVRIAKHLGAGRVIATGRNHDRLEALLESGADEIIALQQRDQELAKRFREVIGAGVDIILDYLWGKSAEFMLAAMYGNATGTQEPRIRFVQIGAASGLTTIPLSASILRSSGLELFGSGLGSNSHQALVAAVGEMLQAAGSAKLTVDVEAVPLEYVESAWERDTGERRLVLTV